MKSESCAISIKAVYITEDNKAKAIYSDNSVLLLSPDAGCFVHIDTEGKQTRQLTAFAINKYRPQLTQLLAFRNQFLPTCYHTVWLGVTPGAKCFTEDYEITSVRWPPLELALANEAFVTRSGDGTITVRSEDLCGQVGLDATGRRIEIIFPLLIEETKQKYKYVWQRKMFPVSQYPKSWEPGVRLAFNCRNHFKNISKDFVSSNFIEKEVISDLSYKTDLPKALPEVSEKLDQFLKVESGSWWAKPTSILPTSEQINIYWNPEALFHFLVTQGEVEVWVERDRSVLCSIKGGKYFAHIIQGGPGGEEIRENIFISKLVPDYFKSDNRDILYSLADLTQKAITLRENSMYQISLRKKADSDCVNINGYIRENERIISSEVAACQKLHGLGEFTCFTDGRIKIKFLDRAILNIDKNMEKCNLILPNGQRLEVRVANPVGAEAYVRAALECSKKLCINLEEFKYETERAETVNRFLERCKRSALICEWEATGKIPIEIQTILNNGDDTSDCNKSAFEEEMSIKSVKENNSIESKDRYIGNELNDSIENLLLRNQEVLKKLKRIE